jgi:hypothetical protein
VNASVKSVNLGQGEGDLLIGGQESSPNRDARKLLLELLTNVGDPTLLVALAKVWNDAMRPKWPSLTVANLQRYVKRWKGWKLHGPIVGVHQIVCATEYFEQKVSDFIHGTKAAPSCKCIVGCNGGDDDDEDGGGGESTTPTCPRKRHPPGSRPTTLPPEPDGNVRRLLARQLKSTLTKAQCMLRFGKRGAQVGGSRNFAQSFGQPSGRSLTVTFTSSEYPGPCEFDEDDDIYSHVMLLEDSDDCLNLNVNHNLWEDIPIEMQLQGNPTL